MAKQQELEQALRLCQADAADLELRLEAAERGCLQASTATHDLQTQVLGSWMSLSASCTHGRAGAWGVCKILSS